MKNYLYLFGLGVFLFSCQCPEAEETKYAASIPNVKEKVEEFASFKLTADVSSLSVNQKNVTSLV